jgi:hypothetical protein
MTITPPAHGTGDYQWTREFQYATVHLDLEDDNATKIDWAVPLAQA